MLQILITILLVIVISLILYIKYKYSYWAHHDIPYIKAKFPFGNVTEIFMKRDTFGHVFKLLYDDFKAKKHTIGGYYFILKPEILVIDPEIVKCVLAKDFAHFSDRGVYIDEENDPISAHLFSLPGSKWRHLRTKLSPTFTSGKMKMMFSTILTCSNQLKEILIEQSKKSEPIEMKDILSRFTSDVIGSAAFGIDCNSMKDPNNDFLKYGLQVMEVKGLDVIRQLAAIAFPKFMKFLGIPGINPKVSNFFKNVVQSTIDYREKNNIQRNDFMQLLLDIKNNKNKLISEENNDTEKVVEDGLTFDQIAAQCFVFYLAGFDTSSTAITFALYELAANEDVQRKTRHEIRNVLQKHNGQLTYDAVMDMPYLDKVLSETLRKYPSLPFLNREVTIDYNIPGTNYVAKKGTPFTISVEGLQWDPEYYPNPEKFDPERFSEEEKLKRPNYTYIPFGEGPRICIGTRFGQMQSKIAIIEIIANFNCKVNSKTKEPLVMSPKNFLMSAEGGIWLDLIKI